MNLLKDLLEHHSLDNPHQIVIISEYGNHSAALALQAIVEKATLERRSMEIRRIDNSLAQAKSSIIVELDWLSLTVSDFAKWIHDRFEPEAASPMLLVPLVNCLNFTGTKPNLLSGQIIDRLRAMQALPYITIYPLLITNTYSPALANTRVVASLLQKKGVTSVIGIDDSRTVDSTNVQTAQPSTVTQNSMELIERWGSICIAILAAGKSSRMGRSKQLERIGGVPMVVQAITTAIRSGANEVVLVTGAYVDEIRHLLQQNKLAKHPLLTIIHNPNYANGQSTSVHAVVNYLSTRNLAQHQELSLLTTSSSKALGRMNVGALTLMPVDQPFLSPAILTRLFKLWRRGAQIVAPSVNGSPRGAPALFDRHFWPQLGQLSGDVGAKGLLRQFNTQLNTFDVDEMQLMDIDRPTDIP